MTIEIYKYKRLTILGLVLIVILLTLIYKAPRQVEYELFIKAQHQQEEYITSIVFNLEVRKQIFTENEVVGTVKVEGNEYEVKNFASQKGEIIISEWIDVRIMFDKLTETKYRLSDIHYNREASGYVENISLDMTDKLDFISGVIRNARGEPIYLFQKDRR